MEQWGYILESTEQFNSIQFIFYSPLSQITNYPQRALQSVHIDIPDLWPHIGSGTTPKKNFHREKKGKKPSGENRGGSLCRMERTIELPEDHFIHLTVCSASLSPLSLSFVLLVISFFHSGLFALYYRLWLLTLTEHTHTHTLAYSDFWACSDFWALVLWKSHLPVVKLMMCSAGLWRRVDQGKWVLRGWFS